MMSDKDAEMLRKLFASIKSKLNDYTSSPEERNLYRKLLKRIKFTIQFNLLKDAYDSSEEFNKLLPYIENKINSYEKIRNSIINKYEEGEVKSKEDILKLITARVQYDKYIELRNLIKDRNFTHYVKSMSNELNIDDDIISICSSTIGSSVDLYGELFDGKEIINYDMLNFIINLSNNTKLNDELKTYFDRENTVLKRTKRMEINKKYLEYLKIINDNKELLRNYLSNIAYIGDSGNEKINELIKEIDSLNDEYDRLNSEFLGSVKNYTKINENRNKLSVCESKLKRLKEIIPTLSGISEKIEEVGLGPIIEAYKKPDKLNDDSVETMVANQLKVKSVNFDYMGIKEKVEEDIERGQKLLDGNDAIIKKALSELSEDTRKFLNMDHDIVKKAVEIINSSKHNGILPLASCFVLKMLVDSKKIDAEDLNKIFKLYQDNEIYDIIGEWSSVVENTTNSLSGEIQEIEETKVTDLVDKEKIFVK